MSKNPQNTELTARYKTFYHLLANSVFAAIINFTIWFAITFYAYIQTQSVLVTGVVAGLYLVATAAFGFWFGSLVDHHKKKSVMLFSSAVSLMAYLVSFALYVSAPEDSFKNQASITLWVFVSTLMVGVIAGNIRNIALPTLVTILIPADNRDKANGLAGGAAGTAMLVTSVISGVLVAHSGMYLALVLAIFATISTIVHLWFVHVPEEGVVHVNEDGTSDKKVDIRGTLKVILGVPGLLALILFTTFNNFLGGAFMALMDAYGLSLVSVEVWGFLWGFLSIGFIVGGLVIAKKGLGKNPLRTMLLANVVIWVISSIFTIQASLILLIVGCFIYMCVMPYIEASEQTVLQKVVPIGRQGRVFGFAQSVEQAASPLTAFIIGPLTQFVFIPFMTDGAGADAIGGWFGTGPARGIALVFTLTGILGLIVTLIAFGSKYYRQLSARYLSE